MLKSRKRKKPINICKMIQWTMLVIEKGKPVCPECGEPAEMVTGIMGEPCWAHVPKSNQG